MTPVTTTRGYSADLRLVANKTYWFSVVSRNISGSDSSALPLRVIAHTPSGTTEPTLLVPGTYTNGVFGITVNGPAGADYVLQQSEDLRVWTSVRTNWLPAMPYSVIVTNTPGGSWFYRVLVQ